MSFAISYSAPQCIISLQSIITSSEHIRYMMPKLDRPFNEGDIRRQFPAYPARVITRCIALQEGTVHVQSKWCPHPSLDVGEHPNPQTIIVEAE